MLTCRLPKLCYTKPGTEKSGRFIKAWRTALAVALFWLVVINVYGAGTQSRLTPVIDAPALAQEPPDFSADAQANEKSNYAVARLLRLERVGELLNFDVITTGCTRASDFAYSSSSSLVTDAAYNQSHTHGKLPSAATRLTIWRLRPDRCRKAPQRFSIQWRLPEPLAYSDWQLLNTFATLPATRPRY